MYWKTHQRYKSYVFFRWVRPLGHSQQNIINGSLQHLHNLIGPKLKKIGSKLQEDRFHIFHAHDIFSHFIVCVPYIVLTLVLFQDVCRLPSTGNSVHVDRLHYMLWRLCNYCWRMWWLPGRRWGSRATIALHHGGDCAWAFHGYRHILQCPCSDNGWPANLAEALPHSCQTNANQGEYHQLLLICPLCIVFELQFWVFAFQEYVVEDVDSEGTDWCPPPLPAEHINQLKSLGLI
jgi:hypothetical protein